MALAVTVPFDTAVTSPVELIVACPVPLAIVHVTVWLVAFVGAIAALSWNVPLSVVIVVAPPAPVTVIPVTGITWLLIVITSVPTMPLPSLAVALAVTVPFDTAVTSPVELIVAWPVPLAIVHVTVWLVAFVGAIAALSWNVPLSVVIVVAPPAPVTVIPVTGITWLLIVITSVPTMPLPSLAVALAVTVPFDTAVTSPVELIVAWPVLLAIVHVTVWLVAFVGAIAALS